MTKKIILYLENLYTQRFLTMDTNIIIDEPASRETMPLSPGKKFHVFVSYRDVSRDKLWVKKVIGKLETDYGYICCDHERDFLPGTKVMDNIKYGVKNSEKVVVVFSKEAIDSYYVSLEAEMALHWSLETRKNLVIPVLLDDCDVPEEFMLLTHINAREGVEETTWWPRLIQSIQSTGEASRSPFYVEGKNVAASKTFAVTQLCSIETKYDYRRRSIQPNSKYIPAKLRPEAFGVPGDLSRAIYKNLLRSPRVECRQKSYFLARLCVLIGYLIFALFLFYFILGIYYITQPKEFINYVLDCIFLLSLLGNCYFPYKLIYVKNPSTVHYKIINYNRILSKYGVQVTVVHGYMWKTASLIFYKCRFELCEEYIIRHLVKEGINHTTEYRDIPNHDRMMASTDGSSLLSGVGNPSRSREEVDSSRQHSHAASEANMNSCYLDIENKSHDFETMFNAEEDTVQSIPILNATNPVMAEEAEYISEVADDKPIIVNQKKAKDLLMRYTPKYLDLAYANKLKNPKEDRHGIEFKCLCQYLEEVDEDFREEVKRTKSLRRKIDIEKNYQDEGNSHFKNILLE